MLPIIYLLFICTASGAFDANHVGAELQKCCPLGSVLLISDEHNFVCRMATVSNGISGHRLSVPPATDESTTTLPHMPSQCELVSELNTNVFETAIDAARTCVDRTDDNRVVGLMCSTSSNDSAAGDQPTMQTLTTTIRRLAKCCAHGSVYDLTERQCVIPIEWEAPTDSDRASESEVLIFDAIRTPDCEANDDDGNAQVFAEFMRSGWHRLRTYADGSVDVLDQIDAMPVGMSSPLKMAAAVVHLPADTFCVDDAVQNATTVANGGGGPIIVRACRSRYECDDGRLTCVRRCCANEEMIERRNGTSACVPYDRNIRPTFYDVRLQMLVADGDGGDSSTTTATTPALVELQGRMVD